MCVPLMYTSYEISLLVQQQEAKKGLIFRDGMP